MNRVLLLLEHRENRQLLASWLAKQYEVLSPELGLQAAGFTQALQQPFDLCIVDSQTLEKLWQLIQSIKAKDPQIFSPFLLLTSNQGLSLAAQHLRQTVDELVTTPVNKAELSARVEILLRTRQLSVELQQRNLQLSAANEEVRHALEKEKELNELKSRFVAMVSHEFRNPLTSITLAAHLLECYGQGWPAERRQDYFLRIKKTIRNMTELLEDVLFIGQTDFGKLKFDPAPLDFDQFCRELLEEIQATAGDRHLLQFQIYETGGDGPVLRSPPTPFIGKSTEKSTEESTAPIVCVDAKLLRHVLTNLLTNAVKYSPTGGNVQFTLTYESEHLILQVQDQGIGIPAEDLPYLFESFHRASNVGKIPGSGLGLSILKRCVDLHQGEIAVESTANVGTTFTIKLPRMS